MENTDAYCQVIWVASQLNGGSLRSIGGEKLKDLIALRKSLGMQDRREGLKECELCDSGEWRPGATCQAPQSGEPTVGLDPEAEAAVKAITDQILAQMK